jgi:hypothetical protein
LLIDRDGHRVEFVAHLPDFGSPNGIVIVNEARQQTLRADDEQQSRGVPSPAAEQGFAVSTLREPYGTFEDWGWYGTGEPPTWFTFRHHDGRIQS